MYDARFGLLLAIGLAAVLCSCAGLDKSDIDIPEGYAPGTLKEFAKQAKVEIVFNAPRLEGIKTNPVEGRMTPQAALDAMLSGTALSFAVDVETGAYAIVLDEISDTLMRERESVSVIGYSDKDWKKMKFF